MICLRNKRNKLVNEISFYLILYIKALEILHKHSLITE